MWVWVKNRYPECNPGKWKHGLKPAVQFLLVNFDPHPYRFLFQPPGFHLSLSLSISLSLSLSLSLYLPMLFFHPAMFLLSHRFI